ncbi:MAG TPA: signal recognition particle-docking protein FtsY [Luteimonas sp.]|nr:signal recognition particle-docking protein FtsY [Luteimonas sp.]
MVSFFRRNKPDAPAANKPGSRYDIEALAAAFPGQTVPAAEPVDGTPATREDPADPAHARRHADDLADAPVDHARDPRPATGDAATRADPPPAAGDRATPIDALRASAEPAVMPAAVPFRAAVSPPVATSGGWSPDELANAAEARAIELAAAAAAAAAIEKSGWRDRLKGTGFARGLGTLFSRNPQLDEDLLDEIETALLTADVGISATTDLVSTLRRRMKAREYADAQALLASLRHELIAMLVPVARPLQIAADARPFVILTVGVNGVGKTTTIGKLARRYKDEGRSLMLAAGDTFRAAAVAQLQAWGDRNGVAVIAQGQNADAASVAFDALQAARARGTEVLIADTAGRLHTQQGLMAELGKIKRVLGKIDPSAPHEVLMVIDGTTGQNAISQVRQFQAAAGVTGLVVTKLDGTAKGGVVFALAREFGLPIRYAGIGEQPEDLRVFDAEAFVDALLPDAIGA